MALKKLKYSNDAMAEWSKALVLSLGCAQLKSPVQKCAVCLTI